MDRLPSRSMDKVLSTVRLRSMNSRNTDSRSTVSPGLNMAKHNTVSLSRAIPSSTVNSAMTSRQGGGPAAADTGRLGAVRSRSRRRVGLGPDRKHSHPMLHIRVELA